MGSAAATNDNGRPQYHPVGIFLHWTMALLVLFQIWWGWRTSLLQPGFDKLDAYGVHALVGLSILSLAFARAGWRIIAPLVLPELEKPEDLPGWQHLAAEITHFALYGLMFALPLSGWVMLSLSTTNGIILPGGAALPDAPFLSGLNFEKRARLEQNAQTAHLTFVIIMMGLISIHVGAALKHHFIDKDDVLSRMIPWLSEPSERKKSIQRAR